MTQDSAPDFRSHVSDLLRQALQSLAPDLAAATPIILERPKQAAHGDFASNLAMQTAKALQRPPRVIAGQLLDALPASPWIDKAEVAGPGFINFTLTAAARRRAVGEIIAAGASYGRGSASGKVQVEFVSANPTGPLHVGHGRGAAYGASLANLLAFAGFDVTREYYVNDAGRQMDILALSTWLRYLEGCAGAGAAGVVFPPNGYRGSYVHDMARRLRDAHGERYCREPAAIAAGLPALPEAERADAAADKAREAYLDALIGRAKELLHEDWAAVHGHALAEQLADCRSDLEDFGVSFEVWFSEKALFDTGLVARAVASLEKAGHIYLQDGARWFRSTAFGDEKDRVVQRDNGIYTYFASDIAYHLNKFERGFDRIINVWGADHHGYIPRVSGALQALGLEKERLDVALVQFAVLYRNGQKMPMSTRSGEFVTLRTLRSEVGNDACRFFYVLRKSDQHLDFDLDLAKSQSSENPVYYIQYAHARIASLLKHWSGSEADLAEVDLAPLTGERELLLAARLAEFPEVVAAAAADLAPHLLAFYLKDLAADFHAWYNAERVLVDDPAVQAARLALAAAVRCVIRNAMRIIGVSCPDAM